VIFVQTATGWKHWSSGGRVGRLAMVTLAGSIDSPRPVIDLLFASSGIESEVVAAAEPIELFPQLTLRVATTDLGDLRALLQVAQPIEITRARTALQLIVSRGYDRGRALLAEFEQLLRTQP
jgi:hypothetical protein